MEHIVLQGNRSTEPVYRQQQESGGINSSSGSGLLPRPGCRLVWNGCPEGTRYDLIATDGNLDLLFAAKGLEIPECRVSEEMIPDSTQAILWRVTAHLPDGRIQSTTTFTTTIGDTAPARE